MKEVLFTLLQAVIIAAVPVITTYLCKFLQTKKEEAKAKTDNETASALINNALDAVTTAVSYTSQTYVDTLKRSGTFTTENQREAFQKAYDTAVQIMTQEAADYIEQVYGGISDWLTAQIEAQVRKQKSIVAEGVLLEAEPLASINTQPEQ